MDQSWFEMTDIRRRKLASAVWIPLRADLTIRQGGKYGFTGFQDEYFGAGSLAVSVDKQEFTEYLGWSSVGLAHRHSPEIRDGVYIPSDAYQDYQGRFTGLHLVLAQRTNELELPEWHLHPDLAISLGLLREQDKWVCPQEGYEEVVRLHRDNNNEPALLEIRSEYLKDYLCARNMALFVTSYRRRREVTGDVDQINWDKNALIDNKERERLMCGVYEIHEGGQPYGQKWAIIQTTRTDVDYDEDVPTIGLPLDNKVETKMSEQGYKGDKLYLIQAELWRDEWVEPADSSPRIKHDPRPPTAFFITDAKGTRESKETLRADGRWLWFRPEVMIALSNRRGGSIGWVTRDTGGVRCSPGYGVHFGVNELGLVNVYAKDIALLPDWQQQIWAGYNVGPDGGVSKELLASQAEGKPAGTQAPEAFLASGLELINVLARANLGKPLLREHSFVPELLTKSHRFRAVDKASLYSLAKDLARLTADSLDSTAIQTIVSPPKGMRWRSLKSLENLLATKVDAKIAGAILSPLFGIYDLRLADAHLPGSEVDNAFSLIGIDPSLPFVHQGFQILHACVSSIYKIAEVLRQWESS